MKSPTPQMIKDLRKKHGLTQRNVAHMLYKTTSTVACWEQGTRTMSPGYYLLLLMLVTMSPGSLEKLLTKINKS